MSEQNKYKRLTFVIMPETLSCLRLYSLSQGLSLSKVLRSIIRYWMDDACITEEGLIDGIVGRAVQGWDKKQFVDPESDFNQFRKHWLINLEKKLPKEICDKIVEKFNKRIGAT